MPESTGFLTRIALQRLSATSAQEIVGEHIGHAEQHWVPQGKVGKIGVGSQHSRVLKSSIHLLEILAVKHSADTAGMVLIQADGIVNLILLLLIVKKREAHALTELLDTSGVDLVIQSIDCFKIIIEAPLYHHLSLVNLFFLAQNKIP